MNSNSIQVATVRAQTDRQHTVASSGPYRYVRHPGYFGTILLHLGVPFMLNSLWAFIPSSVVTLVLIVRTIKSAPYLLHTQDSGKNLVHKCCMNHPVLPTLFDPSVPDNPMIWPLKLNRYAARWLTLAGIINLSSN